MVSMMAAAGYVTTARCRSRFFATRVDRIATIIDTPPTADPHEVIALTKFDELILQYQSFAPLTGHDPSASS